MRNILELHFQKKLEVISSRGGDREHFEKNHWNCSSAPPRDLIFLIFLLYVLNAKPMWLIVFSDMSHAYESYYARELEFNISINFHFALWRHQVFILIFSFQRGQFQIKSFHLVYESWWWRHWLRYNWNVNRCNFWLVFWSSRLRITTYNPDSYIKMIARQFCIDLYLSCEKCGFSAKKVSIWPL